MYVRLQKSTYHTTAPRIRTNPPTPHVPPLDKKEAPMTANVLSADVVPAQWQ
ncbi:uncharacterized protein BO66DRAFT_392889 [Aspergillus aculeatinus CBS 121060]|uniref:Uncharacterized protein n=1 Tax=Aspergillus aculeatinus CBS 121060 TaxID=1448322 RepID=A0ACD1H5D4_9EURO|nr:hypothetical protein BO66DRAFT_392889 [Aspergillus aculeatinus CBS 121060]RAH68836.1 hypothetical protein BO66DRAFT_392889 [Aspergillus aculeatinus CBS 121060]